MKLKEIVVIALLLCPGPMVFGQGACSMQLKPLKPLNPLGCTDTVPVCICDSSGTACQWEWACSERRTTGNRSVPTYEISPPPKVQRPDYGAMREQQLRNQIMQQQIEAQRLILESQRIEKANAKSAQLAGEGDRDLWISTGTGNRFRLRRDDQTVFAELVFSPREDAAVHVGFMLQKTDAGASGKQTMIIGDCTIERDVEVQIMSNTRIEGYILIPPSSAKFNSRKCTFNKPATVKKPFIWLPSGIGEVKPLASEKPIGTPTP